MKNVPMGIKYFIVQMKKDASSTHKTIGSQKKQYVHYNNLSEVSMKTHIFLQSIEKKVIKL